MDDIPKRSIFEMLSLFVFITNRVKVMAIKIIDKTTEIIL